MSEQHGDQSPDQTIDQTIDQPAPDEVTRASAVSHASKQEDPSAQAEGLGDNATGDIVIDSALQDLQGAPADDLDAQIEAGQRVQQTLQGRLRDLGGE